MDPVGVNHQDSKANRYDAPSCMFFAGLYAIIFHYSTPEPSIVLRLKWRLRLWVAWTGLTGCPPSAMWGNDKAGELPPADLDAQLHGPYVALFIKLFY